MKRRLGLAALFAAPVLATTAGHALPASASVPVRGPFLISSSFDNTCGTPEGQLLGSFTATAPAANADGSYDVHVKITANFVTLAGPSFNACNFVTHANSGRTVREGVAGTFVSTGVLHLTSATLGDTSTCPRSQLGSCDLFTYVHSAYGQNVVMTQTSVYAVLHSNAPRLIKRQAVEMCTGAACENGQLMIMGDVSSGHS